MTRSILVGVTIAMAACGASGGGGGGCLSCNPWETCTAGTCVLSGSSQWDLIADRGTVSEKDSAGASWDALGGLPDPKVCVTYNGMRGCTSAKPDTLMPIWGSKLLSRVGAAALMGGFNVEYLDEDLSSDDTICGGNVTIDAAAFRSGTITFTCQKTSSSFDFVLSYAP